jgi:CPA1 family monovalent cation:H+ antiporter
LAEWTYDDTIERMRGMYRYRQRRLAARAGDEDGSDGYESRALRYQKMIRRVVIAQRAEIVRLRDTGAISNEVMHRIERELDLEDERLEI